MKPTEAAALLTIAAAYDNRKPDADQAKAWAMALDGLRFEDCRQVVVEHYQRSREWLMPVDVIRGVKEIRSERLKRFGPIPSPEHIEPNAPDFDEQYDRYMKETMRAIADGTYVRPPGRPSELTSRDVIRELGQAGQSVNAALGIQSVREAHEEARRRKQEAEAEAKRAEGERRAERERMRREEVRERAKAAQHPDHLPTPDPRPEHESNEEKR